MCQSHSAPGRCVNCGFLRGENTRLASELALLREVMRVLCGEHAEEIIRLLDSRGRAVVEGPPALVEDIERQINLSLAVAVAESMTPLIAQLGALTAHARTS